MQARLLLLTFLTSFVVSGCGGGGGGNEGDDTGVVIPRVTYTYSKPNDIGDGWETSELITQGFDVAIISNMMESVINEDYPNIDSVTIVRNNKLVLHFFVTRQLTDFDTWIGNTDPERHILHSTSKSFTSALVGIAIDQGHITSVDVPFYSLFNYPSYENPSPFKDTMTLENALTMEFGLDWDEWALPYSNPQNQLVQLNTNNFDWAKALLDLPIVSVPGTNYTYNTAGTTAIGQAVQNAVGMPLEDFANQYLFYPMQITDAEWARTPSNLPIGGSGLFLKGRDLVKFGQLYLDGGSWQGQQLISQQYVADSVSPHVDISSWATFSEAYGYQWWLDALSHNGVERETWVTSGYGGQYIFVVPDLELVVGFTGHNYETGANIRNLYTMMSQHIMGAIN